MEINFTDEGEHIWLHIKKRKMHTDQVAKNLAHLAGIANKDIGVSGMKDFQAETTQWFSVWLPGVVDADLPNWKELESVGCAEGCEYYGEQRFGRFGSNLTQASDMFASGKRIKQRQKRSMLLSSARSWLFNCVLSERLRLQNWLKAQPYEPLCLEGSRQFFVADDVEQEQNRINTGDIHTSAPLYGRGGAKIMEHALELNTFENESMQEYATLKLGLEKAGLEYTRRPLRFLPKELVWKQVDAGIELSFILGRGQYATSLIRELIQVA